MSCVPGDSVPSGGGRGEEGVTLLVVWVRGGGEGGGMVMVGNGDSCEEEEEGVRVVESGRSMVGVVSQTVLHGNVLGGREAEPVATEVQAGGVADAAAEEGRKEEEEEEEEGEGEEERGG